MAKTFSVEVTEAEYKALAWKYVDPNQHIDDFLTERIHISMDDIATQEIKRRLADPNWTDPIPANKLAVFDTLILKPALQLQQEDTVRILAMVEDPDVGAAIPVPANITIKPT
jgi:hypothetical protein